VRKEANSAGLIAVTDSAALCAGGASPEAFDAVACPFNLTPLGFKIRLRPTNRCLQQPPVTPPHDHHVPAILRVIWHHACC
jgi:hypothetical protein